MTQPNPPLVSIMIPTYNRASMVAKAIESSLTQTYREIEVIVVDNASDDGIEDLIAQYSDNRLKFIRNSANLGQFGNFNRCIEVARGKYVHILHSDDFIDPTFTEKCVHFLENHPEVAMSFSSEVQVLSNGEKKVTAYSDRDQIIRAPEGFKQILIRGNFISCPSVIVRRDVYHTVGNFSLEYPYAADVYQWLKISKKFDIAFVADTALYYRQGEHTESFRLVKQSPVGYLDAIKIFIRVIDELGNEVATYRREINVSIRDYMLACIRAAIWESEIKKPYSPLVFIGFSFNTWALILSGSVTDHIKKFLDFVFILMVGFVLIFPGGRFCLKISVWMKRKFFGLFNM